MAITIKSQFESAVTECNEDIFVQSYIEDSTTIIEFDTRKRNYKRIFKTKSKIRWDEGSYRVDVKELSIFNNPIIYRFIFGRGNYTDSTGSRIFFTPEVDEVSIPRHVSKSVIRLSCFLAVNCGVTLRNIAMLFSMLFLIPVTKSSIKRWIDEIGSKLPSDKELLKELIKIRMPTECHLDGYYPMGTDHCVMVLKDEYDRILITHEAPTESKEEAIRFLERVKDSGLHVVSAFSDYSKSFTESIREVFPDVKFQADHFHTVKNIWKHLKGACLEFRRDVKGKVDHCKSGEKKQELEELAKGLWELRWILLKKPGNLTEDEKQKVKALEKMDKDGFIRNFRSILKNIVSLFDQSQSESSARAKLRRLRKTTNSMDNKHYHKLIKFFDDHWAEAMQYLKKDGTRKRASNSESGMRLLRRLEKNHDGIRSEITRKNYIKIYQTITYLANGDIADFIGNSSSDRQYTL